MVEHPRQHRRRIAPARGLQAFDRLSHADVAVIDLGVAVLAGRPQQRHRLGHVPDIVAAHPQKDRVDPLFGQRPHRRRLNVRDVERSGQRRQRDPAIGVGRRLQIVPDQGQLAVARPCVDEVVEQLAERAHRLGSISRGSAVLGRLEQEPGALLGGVGPFVDDRAGGIVLGVVGQILGLAQFLDQRQIVVAQFLQHVLGAD